MKVLFVTSEIAPWVKTGGLADVSAALPAALRAAGCDVRVLVPAYPALRTAFADAPMLAAIAAPQPGMHGAALRLAHSPSGVPLYLLESALCFERAGNPYLAPDGRDWGDNALRFGLLGHVAALLADSASPLDWRPDILHCNDWQSALAPALLHYHGSSARAATVMTVHNLAFQGLFDGALLAPLGLPASAWRFDGVEFHGRLSFLKAGLQHADALTTVSPTYAAEICTPAHGMGLDGLLRHRAADLHGIVNGIDTQEWNPATDPHLAAPYDAGSIERKALNRSALRAALGLPDCPATPLIGMVSRLTGQKGADLVAALLADLDDAQFVLLGSGDAALEELFGTLAARHPQRIAVRIGFDEALAHRIEAGADLFMMPSRFEPCGLNQLYSLRYGTPPLVHATGGLADTVIDAADAERGNGFVFRTPGLAGLAACTRRALALWREQPTLWRRLQERGMRAEHGWTASAQAYRALYRTLRQPA